MPQVRINLNPDGTGRVTVGDTDISAHVSGVSIDARPGRVLDIRMGMTRAIAEIEAFGRLDHETAAALIELGWTPPENPTSEAPL
jgi:hypothetical protein